MTAVMNKTIEHIAVAGKGLLAADESTNTIAKRFADINLESTESNRQAYRDMLLTTPGLQQYICGVILFEETLFQSSCSSPAQSFVSILEAQGIVPGIKVDLGLVPLAHSQNEQVTQGLDGLPARVEKYFSQGARFAKWRAVYRISEGTPSALAVATNAECLARYAAICQAAQLVPIVEPEILMDGAHTIEHAEQVMTTVLDEVFVALRRHHVDFSLIILKPGMVINGVDCAQVATSDQVAQATIRAFQCSVPAAVPTINFLSGGQSNQQATENLQAINAHAAAKPWNISFSYGRALQSSAIRAWGGRADQVQAGQEQLLQRARLNSAAALGQYNAAMEEQVSSVTS